MRLSINRLSGMLIDEPTIIIQFTDILTKIMKIIFLAGISDIVS